MKDLVYIFPDKDAGVASVVRNLLKFKTAGYSTKVILIHNFLDDDKRRCDQESFKADVVINIIYNPKVHSKSSILKKISKHLNQKSVLIANDGNFDLDALKYLNINIATVYIMHGDYGHYYNAIKGKTSLISKIITVSDYLKQEVINILQSSPLENSNLKVDSIKFPVPRPNMNFANKSNSDQIRIVFVGSLTEFKGVLSFKKIFDYLDKLEINYVFNIIGGGKEDSFLKQQFNENSNVHFLGRLSNIEVIKSHINHDILILPSKGEGLPVVIVEAMKCGVIPMATNLKSGIPELIEHAVNGFTVDLMETHKYAEYIAQLSKDKIMLNAMAQLNIEKANAMFDPILQTKAYEKAFNDAKIISFKESFIKKLLAKLPMNLEYNIIKRIS